MNDMPKKGPQGFWPQILVIPGLDFMESTTQTFWTCASTDHEQLQANMVLFMKSRPGMT